MLLQKANKLFLLTLYNWQWIVDYIHGEKMSNREAHGSCVFLFWHQQFILGFENMLRSLGPQYACITLPYYNFVQHYTNFQAGKCTTFETCSQILLDLGGPTNGNVISQTIYNRVISPAVCVKSLPLNHFCDSSSTCSHCVARGPWKTRPPPLETGFATVYSALFAASDIKSMSAKLETTTYNWSYGIHYNDPTFFVLHSTLDALYTIFYKCNASSLQLAFQGCTTRNNQPVGPSSTILMRYYLPNGNLILATDLMSPVAAFFSQLPYEYYKLVDTATLGPGNSYVYELKELLGQMYTQCVSTKLSRRLESPQQQIVSPVEKWLTWNVLAHRHEVHSIGKGLNMTSNDINIEIFKMQLVHHNTCLVEIVDFTRDFKSEWHINGTRPAISLLNQLNSGEILIRIPNWRDINAKYFPCPLNTTN
ncbi:hypothetical protein THRCLA_22821 [Thraustotheca clavata]|uniref:Tyrosinase copper-binding domain-containing protein n=1 Tax=Thraustotheca clavata TaxID=74557 RepID=A0A1V9YSU1_9STRA|nr:hypothetical protein THRCLA_22821 [Thraustotheca clavata]